MDINNDGWLDLIIRSFESGLGGNEIHNGVEESTKSIDRILVWVENSFKDLSQKYLSKLDLNKYPFKSSINKELKK